MPVDQPEFRPARTLNGLFDAYCKVCWCPVYVLWVDKEDPAGRCMYGHTAATDCPEAMGRARTAASLAKLRAEGKLKLRRSAEEPRREAR